MPLLFAYVINRFSHDMAHMCCISLLLYDIVSVTLQFNRGFSMKCNGYISLIGFDYVTAPVPIHVVDI